jgi:organic hydroperoxide reductase OsmC/OhrA
VELVAGKLQVTSLILTPRVTVQSREEVDRAKELLTKAESNCLISNSVKSHITMNPTVSSAEL